MACEQGNLGEEGGIIVCVWGRGGGGDGFVLLECG